MKMYCNCLVCYKGKCEADRLSRSVGANPSKKQNCVVLRLVSGFRVSGLVHTCQVSLLGGRLPLFDLISLLNIYLPPSSGNLPLFEAHFLPIIFSLKRVNCFEFCNENVLLSQQSIHRGQ